MSQIIKYSLLCLSLFGIWVMWIVPALCGSAWLLVYESQAKEFVGATYTGLPVLDKALSPFLLASTLISDTGIAVENLQMAGFLGSMAGIWMMTAIENYQTNSRERVAKGILLLISPSMVAGSLVWMPAYLALNYFPPRSLRQSKDSLESNPQVLYDIQLWVILFFYLPLLSLSLPPSMALSPSLKQHAIMLMITSPFWVATAIVLSGRLCLGKTSTAPSVKRNLNSLYTSTFISVSIFHVLSIVVAIAINKERRSILAASLSALKMIFIPCLSWKYPVTSSTTELVFFMWQWDYIICAIAAVLWSVSLYIHECRLAKLEVGYTKLCLTIMLQSIIVGPYASSVRVLAKRNKISEWVSPIQKDD